MRQDSAERGPQEPVVRGVTCHASVEKDSHLFRVT